jgi:hypothetical protein
MLAIAGLGSLVLAVFSSGLQRELQAVGLPPSLSSAVMDQRALLAATTAPPNASASTKALVHRAVDDAYLQAYRMALFVCAGLAVAGSLVVVFTVAPRPRAPAAVTSIAQA